MKITRRRISNFASAFKAEVLALNDALKLSGQLFEKYSTVKIYTDSKSSLQSLLNEQRTSTALAEKQILAHQLDSNITLHLQWIPGHRNTEGNEWADRIAKSSTTINYDCLRHTRISQNVLTTGLNWRLAVQDLGFGLALRYHQLRNKNLFSVAFIYEDPQQYALPSKHSDNLRSLHIKSFSPQNKKRPASSLPFLPK